MQQLLLEFVMTCLATIGFGIIINIPHRALLVAGLIGGLAWSIYWVMLKAHYGLAMSALAATLVIALLSLFAARKMKMPMIIFSIPGIVPLVPGGQAYQMVRHFALGDNNSGIHFMMQVIEIAGSIGIGFLLAEFIDRLHQKIKFYMKNRKLKDNT